MGMVEVSRIIGLCSAHLTIRIPSSVLEAMGVLPIPSACVRVCAQAGICAHVFVGDTANKLSVPSPLGYRGPL